HDDADEHDEGQRRGSGRPAATGRGGRGRAVAVALEPHRPDLAPGALGPSVARGAGQLLAGPGEPGRRRSRRRAVVELVAPREPPGRLRRRAGVGPRRERWRGPERGVQPAEIDRRARLRRPERVDVVAQRRGPPAPGLGRTGPALLAGDLAEQRALLVAGAGPPAPLGWAVGRAVGGTRSGRRAVGAPSRRAPGRERVVPVGPAGAGREGVEGVATTPPAGV